MTRGTSAPTSFPACSSLGVRNEVEKAETYLKQGVTEVLDLVEPLGEGKQPRCRDKTRSSSGSAVCRLEQGGSTSLRGAATRSTEVISTAPRCACCAPYRRAAQRGCRGGSAA